MRTVSTSQDFVPFRAIDVDESLHVSVQDTINRASLPVPALSARPEIRVLIADDHAMFRAGLQALLETQPDFNVVGQASDGEEALNLARKLTPDLMLVDLTMPKRSGLEVMRALNRSTGARMVALTSAVKRSDVLPLLQYGARGIVLKSSSTELLFKCIRKVHAGEIWIDRATVAHLVEQLTKQNTPEPSIDAQRFGLTPREAEILALLVDGESNKEIAKRLSIGQDTVKHHLTNIFNKTGRSNRLELATFALNHRLGPTAR